MNWRPSCVTNWPADVRAYVTDGDCGFDPVFFIGYPMIESSGASARAASAVKKNGEKNVPYKKIGVPE